MSTSGADTTVTAAIGTTTIARASEAVALETPVLGSCVAIVAHCRDAGVAAVTSLHTAGPGDFETALDELHAALAEAGVDPRASVHDLVGGADPVNLEPDHPFAAGAANLVAARAALAAAGIEPRHDLTGGGGPWRVSITLREGALDEAPEPRLEDVSA